MKLSLIYKISLLLLIIIVPTIVLFNIFNKIYIVLLIAMMLVFLFVCMYWIIRPIKLVITGAKAIGKGNLDYRIQISSGDEMEELANSFNNMATELQNKARLMRKRTQELSALYEMVKTISQSLDIDEVLKKFRGCDTDHGSRCWWSILNGRRKSASQGS